jgi:hypothetical protein
MYGRIVKCIDDTYVVGMLIYSSHIILSMPPLKTKGEGKTIRITPEAHKMLIELSSSKVETFSDVIIKLGEHYKRTKK